MSTVVLLVSRAVDSHLLERQLSWLDKSNTILDEMVYSGNRIAESRKCEMKKLEDILGHFISKGHQRGSGAHVSGEAINVAPADDGESVSGSVMQAFDGDGESIHDQLDNLTAQQIMAVVSSMESEDTEWMSLMLNFNQP